MEKSIKRMLKLEQDSDDTTLLANVVESKKKRNVQQ